MARITVEDCLGQIGNRFELSLAAAVRARQLVAGHQALVDDAKRDKPIVVALREIAGGKVNRSVLKRSEEHTSELHHRNTSRMPSSA